MMGRFFLLFACFTLHLYGVEWMRDFSDATQKSALEKKPLLLFFTASDWSGWSMKLKDEVLGTPAFEEKIRDTFVCVEIDSPLHSPPAPENERFDVTDFPTILVLSSDQREIGRFGYLPLTGEQFAENLLSILSEDVDLNYLLDLLARGESTPTILKKAYDLAQELCAQEAIDRVLDYGIESREPGFYLVEKYRRSHSDEVKKRVEELADPELLYHIALIDFQTQENSIAPLEEFLERYGEICGPYKWQLEMMIAQHYLERGEVSRALEHAEVAHESAPSGKQEEISHSVEYMRSVCESASL